MLEHFKVTEATWRDAGKKDPSFLESESPLFVGRVVAALAADDKLFERTGRLTSTWELAREYGVEDYDGRRPDFGRHFTETVAPTTPWFREGLQRHAEWLVGLAGQARGYLTRTLDRM